ncbi:MAG: uncharacterized protein JWM74_1082, partial [Myxococcaceae bacterium]|nr:uncharacterized protein [Myxococcaceae bacterium]
MTVAVGDLIEGKYRLTGLLGTGGWGSVFEGENVRTLHRVAIKVLHSEMSGKLDSAARFEREAQAAGKIGSDHIIEVFDLGQLPTGEHFMVMELLDGEDLASRLTFGVIPPPLLAGIMIQVLEGLGAAHDAGILHRDLKPANLFLLRAKNGIEFVKILDFGISKFGTTPATQTQTGAIMGSPVYMSPEQARGAKDIDHRSDLFSLGVVLFECATGALPFAGANFNELLFNIALTNAPDPRTIVPSLDPGFAEIVIKALGREPSQRFQSAAELQTALQDWMDTNGHTRAEPTLRRKARTPSGEVRSVPQSSPHLEDTVAITSSERIPLAAPSGPAPVLPFEPRATASPSVTLVTTSHPPRRRWVAILGAAAVPVAIVVAGLWFTRTRAVAVPATNFAELIETDAGRVGSVPSSIAAVEPTAPATASAAPSASSVTGASSSARPAITGAKHVVPAVTRSTATVAPSGTPSIDATKPANT